LTVDGDSYTVLFDLDVRKQFFGGDEVGDFAQQAFCGVDEPFTQCNFRFTFAISEGGWVDDIELNLLNGDPVSVPEPATGAMLIVGLVAAGSMMRRQSGRKET
jgi:PEP-CTERM motif